LAFAALSWTLIERPSLDARHWVARLARRALARRSPEPG
jgi:hypothetical protein